MRYVIRATTLAMAILWTFIAPAHAQRVRIPTADSQDTAADNAPASSDQSPATAHLWTARAQLVDPPPGSTSPLPPPTYAPTGPTSPYGTPPPAAPAAATPDPYLGSGNPSCPSLAPGPSYQPYPAYPPPGALLAPQPVLCEFPWQAFAEFLYLQPRNAEIGYAIPVGAGGVQNGSTGIVEPGYNGGFSLGLAHSLTSSSSLGATFTHFESNTPDSIAVAAPDSIRPVVLIPGTPEASDTYLSASAYDHMQFTLADLDYRGIFSVGDHYSLNYVVGARYANLSQVFDSNFFSPGAPPPHAFSEEAYSNIGFDGGGIRVGMEGQRFAQGSGLMVYAKGYASFMAGRFNSTYFQNDSALGTVATSNWISDRVVPILDVELGVGWTSPGGRVRFTGGYMFSAWYNAIQSADFIRAAQQTNPSGTPSLVNNFNGINDTLTFDGFNVRMEIRY